jgi:hypothetical protein
MSSNSTYTPDTNSPRWPLWAMAAFAIICCIVFWRSCDFQPETHSTDAPAATEQGQ